jgi:hypothetical protein
VKLTKSNCYSAQRSAEMWRSCFAQQAGSVGPGQNGHSSPAKRDAAGLRKLLPTLWNCATLASKMLDKRFIVFSYATTITTHHSKRGFV